MKKSLLHVVLFCMLLGNAKAAPIVISCVMIDTRDGEKDELEIKFDDDNKSQIMVNGARIPRAGGTYSFTLDQFGASLIKWSVLMNNELRRYYTIDRTSGSAEVYSLISDKITERGKCIRSLSENKF